jgi:hypothetical protein
MTDLSPATQAVMDAAKSSLDWEAGYLPNAVAAAALRAAADQVVPEGPKLGPPHAAAGGGKRAPARAR